MELWELDNLLNRTPVIVDIHPLSLLWFILPTNYVNDGNDFQKMLDDPRSRIEGRYVIAEQKAGDLKYRFPCIDCNHDPFVPELNKSLYKNFDYAKQNMTTISELTQRIIDSTLEFDVVCLVLIDGLSYAQVKKRVDINTKPCLVDVPTLTEYAFPAIVRNGAIPRSLVPKGFDLHGYNYWNFERDDLCAKIFAGFSAGQVQQVASFREIIKACVGLPLGKHYIQIIRMGLDQYSHDHFDKPNIEMIVNDIISDLLSLKDTLKFQGHRAAVFAIADHGIIWRIDPAFEVLNGVIPRGKVHMRYFEHNEIGKMGKPWGENGQIWQLDYPYLRRRFYINEWGCHGGISFEECVVPWIEV